jgi:hypothetical protein
LKKKNLYFFFKFTEKVFAVERAIKTATEPFYTFGPGTVLADNKFVENYKNSIQLLAQGETLDSLKIFIALSGLQYAGVSTLKKYLFIVKKNCASLFF